MKIIGLYNPMLTNPRGFVPKKYYRALFNKANPRNLEYMTRLFSNAYSRGMIVNTTEPFWHEKIEKADKLVLLYPDAIGLGFTEIEKKIKHRCFNIEVINGRNRRFIWNREVARRLRFKRFLEKSMVLELCVTPIFLITALFLFIKDTLKANS